MTVSRHLRRACATLMAGAVATGLGAVAPARADEISADGAQKLEQQVHDWLAALLGPLVPVGERPLHVTAEADHYRVEAPFADLLGSLGVTVQGAPVSAALKPLAGGRWAIDDVRAPSPLTMSYALPGDGKGGDAPAETLTATIGSQHQHGVLDPSFATPSTMDGTIKGYTSTIEGEKDLGKRTTSIDEITYHLALDPVDGRLDVVEDTDSHLLASNTVVPNIGLASFSVEKMHGSLRLDGVAPDRVASLVHAAMELAPLGIAAAKQQQGAPDLQAIRTLAEQNRKAAADDRAAADADKQAVAEGRMTPADRRKNTEARIARAKERMKAMQALRAPNAAKPVLTGEQRTAMHDALVAVADLLQGFDQQVSMENVHVVGAGYTGHLAKFATELSVDAPAGKVTLHFHVGLDGLDSPDIPPGVFRDYLPRHISITPRIGGVPAAALHDLLLHAADNPGDDPQMEAEAKSLLDKGPVVVGLEELSLDFGPATLTGSGELRVIGTDQYDGDAQFKATGLDDLIAQANTVPELKQAGPVLFLLKGMGKQDGDATVWNISYHDKKVLVNGNDLSAMLPGK